jgi:hypothetical protein
MRNAWVCKVGMIALVGGLCLVGYGLAHAEKPIKDRFVVLSKDPAWVLDRTTGLQWQKAPSSEPLPWTNAVAYCPSLGDGSRLPEIKELISLVDYSHYAPALPDGNPFQGGVGGGGGSNAYWSAETFVAISSSAWFVGFVSGAVNYSDKSLGTPAWCVR